MRPKTTQNNSLGPVRGYGNRVRRIPEETYRFTPTYRFGDKGFVYLGYFYSGSGIR